MSIRVPLVFSFTCLGALALALAACSQCQRSDPAGDNPMEIYGDPKIFSTPRLQFSWRPTGEKDWTLWSVRLDGTDLRRVVRPELLHRFKVRFSRTPVRSPDNRYVAAEADDYNHVLIDLKTQTAKVIAQGGSWPYYQWTEDSRALIFYQGFELKRYHLATGKLEDIPMIYSQGLHLLRGTGNFLAFRSWGFVIHGPDGKELRSVTLGEHLSHFHAATPDGRLLAYLDDLTMVVIRTDDPKHPIYSSKRMSLDFTFGPGGRELFFEHDGSIHKVNLSTKKVSLVFKSPGRWTVSDITVFNDRSGRR